MGQLDYIARVEARVEARERRVNATASQRESLEQEAQDPAATADESMDLDSASSAQLSHELETFWSVFADFGNSMMLAFPREELPSAREEGVWLEEDVDLLGFAPLRRGMKEGVQAADGQGGEMASVGKEVHPNEEQLMRIEELQGDASLISEAEVSRAIRARDELELTRTLHSLHSLLSNMAPSSIVLAATTLRPNRSRRARSLSLPSASLRLST